MHSLIIFGLLFPGEFTAGTDPRPERERGPHRNTVDGTHWSTLHATLPNRARPL